MADVTVWLPELKASIYKKKPTAPERISQPRSLFAGNLIFLIRTTAARKQDAVKYRRNPRENGGKYCKASLVKTYPSAQKKIVTAA